jgi:hypothetical protein
VRSSKTPANTYLIPIKNQDFRLETGAPVYVEFKSIPYSAVDVLEWFQRIQKAQLIYNAEGISCSDLEQLAEDQDITKAVFQNAGRETICPEWTLDYQDQTYQVWRFVR